MNNSTTNEKPHGTILVADDIPANRNLLRQTLEPQGYEVLLADSGETALKAARRAAPDLILLDINMGGIDGYETCRRLKQEEVTRAVPVIFISANEAMENVLEGFRAGGVDYVTKPFKAEEVLMRVDTHLKISRLTRVLQEKNAELTRLNLDLQNEILRRQQAEKSLELISEQQGSRFQTGGTLRHDAPSYLERRADQTLIEGLFQGELCHVLTSRQMGKSSLMVRTAQRLKERGWRVVTLDLTAVGQNLTPEQWYGGLLSRLGWQLELDDALEQFALAHGRLGPVQRFFAALRQVVLPTLATQPGAPMPGAKPPANTPDTGTPASGRLIIFVDECDTVRSLPFSCDEFFAAIRETYNRRSEDPELNRITFCLLGVATPSELIKNPSLTPFTVGRRVELEDFTRPELGPWVFGLGREPAAAQELMDRVYWWTQGHPYLTQKLCKAITADEAVQTPQGVDELCSQLALSPKAREQDANLVFVRERLLRGNPQPEKVLHLYERIRNRETVPWNEADPLLALLRISGLVRESQGSLKLRNRIYETVFDHDWVRAMLDRKAES